VVIAGHARLMAAIELDLKTVPVIRVTHLTDAQVKAFRIADNRLVELSEWDNAALAVEFEAIIEGGVELDLTGFSVPEVDLVFSDAENDEAEEAEVELPTGEPVSRAGDVWIMDGHRILCGNALDVEAYGELMEPERAAMVFSDPPYNVPIEGHVSGKGRHSHREFIMASGEMTEPDFFKFLERSIQNAMRFSRFDAPVFLFMDWRHATTLHLAARQAGLEQINLCVWMKANGGMGSLYRSQHELVLVFAREGARIRNNVGLGRYGRNRSNVWQYAGANSIRSETRDALADHPTPKPVRLVADAILDVTRQGDIVLDMFLGAGATLIACERTRRRCHGIELDPLYVDACIRRWQNETGRPAHLAETDETFDDVMARRSRLLLLDLREAS
jgi:DNA modification methylase